MAQRSDHYHFWIYATEWAAPDYIKAVRSFQTFRHRVQAVRASKRVRLEPVLLNRVHGVKTAVCTTKIVRRQSLVSVGASIFEAEH